jgi:hypothetical protein
MPSGLSSELLVIVLGTRVRRKYGASGYVRTIY